MADLVQSPGVGGPAGAQPVAIGRLLYRESGLLGLSSDMREREASSAPQAALAIDYFVEHIQRELAAMVAALQGIDTLVFTGDIGENAATLRARVVQGAAWMGLALDAEANQRSGWCGRMKRR